MRTTCAACASDDTISENTDIQKSKLAALNAQRHVHIANLETTCLSYMPSDQQTQMDHHRNQNEKAEHVRINKIAKNDEARGALSSRTGSIPFHSNSEAHP